MNYGFVQKGKKNFLFVCYMVVLFLSLLLLNETELVPSN